MEENGSSKKLVDLKLMDRQFREMTQKTRRGLCLQSVLHAEVAEYFDKMIIAVVCFCKAGGTLTERFCPAGTSEKGRCCSVLFFLLSCAASVTSQPLLQRLISALERAPCHFMAFAALIS